MDAVEPVTGLDLKVERVRANLSNKVIAAAMGVSPGRLTRIEQADRLTERMIARYRRAIETCRTSGTQSAA